MTLRRTIFGLGILLVASGIPISPVLAEVNGIFAVNGQSISWSHDFTEFKNIVQSAPAYRIDDLSLAFDPGGWLYWIDTDAGAIRRTNFTGAVVEDVIGVSQFSTALALDATAQKLYWGDSSGRVYRAQTDGSNQELVVPASSIGIAGIALDTAHGRIFFTTSSNLDGSIQSANLDGSNLQIILSGSEFRPAGIAVDAAAQRIYWTDDIDCKIHRANYDGSGSVIFRNLTAFAGCPQNQFAPSKVLSIDPVNRQLYWFFHYFTRELWRTSLDSTLSGPNLRLQSYSDNNTALATAIDPVNQTLYHYRTYDLNLVGTSLQPPYATESVLGHDFFISEVVLDPREAGKLYWVDDAGNRIFRSSVAGSNMEVFILDGGMSPARLSLDLPGNHIFWANVHVCYDSENYSGTIFTRSLDGPGEVSSGINTISNTGCAAAMAGDWTHDWAFWLKLPFGTIYRDDFLSGESRVFITSGTITQIMTDGVSGNFYILSRDGSTDAFFSQREFDGAIMNTISLGPGVYDTAILDHQEGKIYWLQTRPGGLWIRRCNFNLTGVEDVAGPVPTDRGTILIDNRQPYCTRTALYGDITGLEGSVEFMDISAIVDAFRGQPSIDSTLCDLFPCDLGGSRCMGDGIIDFQDISQVVNAFRGVFTCPQ